MAELSAYMAQHKIHAIFTDITESLLVTRPARPLDHLMSALKENYPDALADWKREEDDEEDNAAESEAAAADRQAKMAIWLAESIAAGDNGPEEEIADPHKRAAKRVRMHKSVAREARRMAADAATALVGSGDSRAPGEADLAAAAAAVAVAALEPWRDHFVTMLENHMLDPERKLDDVTTGNLRYNGCDVDAMQTAHANSTGHASVRLLAVRLDATAALWDALAERGFTPPPGGESAAKRRAEYVATGCLLRLLIELRRDCNCGAVALSLKSKPVLLIRIGAPCDVREGDSFFRQLVSRVPNLKHVAWLHGGSTPALDDVYRDVERMSREAGATFLSARAGDWDARLDRWRAALDLAAAAARDKDIAAEAAAAHLARRLISRVLVRAVLRPGNAPPEGHVLMVGFGGMRRTGLLYALARRWANRESLDELVKDLKQRSDWRSASAPGAFEPYHEKFLREFDFTFVDATVAKIDGGDDTAAAIARIGGTGAGGDPLDDDEERSLLAEAEEDLPDDRTYLGNGIKGST